MNSRKVIPKIPPSGPAMQERLHEVGIEARRVVRRRDTGHYIADFFIPGMQTPIDPSKEWARKMEQRLVGLRVLKMDDTLADWRADKPVIWASVTFAVDTGDLPAVNGLAASWAG
jgi:hypothetical protein